MVIRGTLADLPQNLAGVGKDTSTFSEPSSLRPSRAKGKDADGTVSKGKKRIQVFEDEPVDNSLDTTLVRHLPDLARMMSTC